MALYNKGEGCHGGFGEDFNMKTLRVSLTPARSVEALTGEVVDARLAALRKRLALTKTPRVRTGQ